MVYFFLCDVSFLNLTSEDHPLTDMLALLQITQTQALVKDLDVKLAFQSLNRFGLAQLVPAWVVDCFLCSFIDAKLHNVSLGCATARLKADSSAGVSILCGLSSIFGGWTQR